MAFNTDKTLPICEECKWHFESTDYYAYCTHPKIKLKQPEEMSLITGKVYPAKYWSCDSAREDIGPIETILLYLFDGYTKCGSKGRKWEAKK